MPVAPSPSVRLILSAAISLGLAAHASAQSPAPSPVSRAAMEAVLQNPEVAELRNHGVSLEPSSLQQLLEKGIPEAVLQRGLPDKPHEKSQLAVYAMARLATAKHADAVPVLIGIAALNPPPGVESLLRIDTQNTSPENRDEFRRRALKLLQFNAINALGLIGDTAALPIMRAAFNEERHPAARIQHAISMANLGDPGGVDFLVQVIQMANRRESAAAARAFYIITGQDFGYTENTALKMRGPKAREYANWWRGNRAAFQVDRDAVSKRRLEAPPMPTFQPRNTRDLVKLSAFYFDFNNQFRTFEARRQLEQGGKSHNDDLLRLMNDEAEDLDVRLEAMNWFYEFNRAEARRALRRLRSDENPEVVDKANSLLEQVESDAAGQRQGR